MQRLQVASLWLALAQDLQGLSPDAGCIYPHAEGSSEAVRRAAGQQVADIVRKSPRQLLPILSKVGLVLSKDSNDACHTRRSDESRPEAQVAAGLQNKDWSARTGCAACLGLLAELVQHHDCRSLAAASQDDSTVKACTEAQHQHRLEGFPLDTVLAQGTVLLAAEQQVRDAIVAVT